jgi:preprotein translocase subunit YajC
VHPLILAATAQSKSSLTTFLPVLLIFGVFYFFILRPRQAKMRAQQQAGKTIEPGTDIMTRGGIYGTVVDRLDDEVFLKIADGVTIRIHPDAIGRVISHDEEPAEAEEEQTPPVSEDPRPQLPPDDQPPA